MNATWRDTTSESLDADLARLWRDAAEDAPVSRALMSNLVVVSPTREFSDVEELARKHPARIILLGYTPGCDEAAAPEGFRIGLLTFGEGAARYGIEIIALHAACANASLPSIVRRLTIGNVPTTIWWTADLSRPTPPGALGSLGRQIVYDSALWEDVTRGVSAAADFLRLPQAPDLADLNWRRTAPLRDALIHAFRQTPPAARATTIRITHGEGHTAAAWLLAGWLESRLKMAASAPEVEIETGSEGVVVTIDGHGWTLAASMADEHVEVRSESSMFRVATRRESESDAVAAELVSLSPDAGLCDALLALRERQQPRSTS